VTRVFKGLLKGLLRGLLKGLLPQEEATNVGLHRALQQGVLTP